MSYVLENEDDDEYISEEDEDFVPDEKDDVDEPYKLKVSKDEVDQENILPEEKNNKAAEDDSDLADGRNGDPSEQIKSVENRQKLDDLWESLNAETSNALKRKVDTSPIKKTTIVKRVKRFAGEDIVVEEELVLGSEEHTKWLQAESRRMREEEKTAAQASIKMQPIDMLLKNGGKSATTTAAAATTTSAVAASVSSPVSLTGKPKPKEKEKSQSALDAALKSLTGGKKMSSVEKSRLDWDNYVAKKGIKDELRDNRRGGGYLDTQAFLQRTDLRQFEEEKKLRTVEKRREEKKAEFSKMMK